MLLNAKAGTLKLFSGVTISMLCFGLSSWERPVSGHGFQSCLNLAALQDKFTDMCFYQEVVNMPGMKTGQARSLFGQD